MPLERFPAGHDLTCTKDAGTIEHPDVTDASNSSSNVCQGGEILNADQTRKKGKVMSGDVGEMRTTDTPPDDEILPRSGTHGVMSSRSSATIFSRSSQRTAECPRTSELMRTRIAPRTHDSGILVIARGSDNGSAWSGPWKDATDGNTPVW
jgi:hypothetical protein